MGAPFQKKAGGWGGLGPCSGPESAELRGLGQRHMWRELTENPQARRSLERLGLAGRPRKGGRSTKESMKKQV